MEKKKQSISRNGCYCASNDASAGRRRVYCSPCLLPLAVEFDSSFLTGSVLQNKPIKETVTVETFVDGTTDFDAKDFEITFE